MKSKPMKGHSAGELDRMAADQSDVKPMSPAMRRKWESAQKSGKRIGRGRAHKTTAVETRIVPVSLDPSLLSEADRYARNAGISRSRLVAEALRLRMNQTTG